MSLNDVQPPYDLFEVEVKGVEQVTPHLKRLTVALDHVPGLKPDLPGQWLKVFVRDEDGRRLPGRAYTLRRLDQGGTAEIDFVLHGDEGRISAWAARAVVGDSFEVSAPHARSGFSIDPSVRRYVLAADETGFPAVAAILEALPEEAEAVALIDVADAAEEQDVRSRATVVLKWLHRNGRRSDKLAQAVRALDIQPGTAVFVAAESGQVTAIRSWVKALGPAVRLDASGYWKRGEADHRDDEA